MPTPIPTLIAGPRFFALCSADHLTPQILHEGAGPYYGISWSESEIFLLSRNRPRNDQILVFSPMLELKRVIPFDRQIDGHQILYLDGRLLVTATWQDEINVVDPQSGLVIDRWNWTGCHEDVHHINGIGYHDHQSLWISCDNRKGVPSEILLLPLMGKSPLRKIVCGNPSLGSHNIEEELATQSGDTSAVVDIRWDPPMERFRAENQFFRGLARGTAFNREILLVGASSILKRTQRNEPRQAFVYVLDRTSFQQIRRVEISRIGQLYEVRSLQEDYSHNRIICPIQAPSY